MEKHDKQEHENRFPGVDPIPDPDSENPSATSMIEDVLKEGTEPALKPEDKDE
ncbi:hypothetical protein ACTHPF_09915 [Paenibacillus sp. SAF-054]|uniref:hypothetical protein n=1 Tax=unclassified Paenibacillus TaxID=185978 RepID=UPI003F8133F4